MKQDLGQYEGALRFLKKGITTTTIELGNSDPDEAIKNDRSFFKKQLKNDIGIYDYMISVFAEKI